ncbi:Solitary outer membrane autotransporter beta-barrel domain [Pseudoalteromonas sp. MMG010]|uniref:Solitary outer membrane autotransporter beta-barrel domain n=1 Tax=Pseudoalteromonas sp. MMG010 TaxID=2822685 RepID=UPI001B3A71C5|nr:Solitary outer membrane autotransporter beta-barrel domain [Pseudoalteromonas sp. MMG010]MBQ4834212.1 Solitary outer membrane autotransporter beta-barrel domain [Pseudoalteromonas sp. MMG010]
MLKYPVVFILLSASVSIHATPLHPSKFIEQAYAVALILNDGDNVTLGFSQFNPSSVISPHHSDQQQQTELDVRRELNLYSLPLKWQLETQVLGFSTQLLTQVSYLKQTQKVLLFDQVPADNYTEQMKTATIGIKLNKPINDHWYYQIGLNSQYMLYSSDYDYLSEQSSMIIKPAIDGVYVNNSSNTLAINPSITLGYSNVFGWGELRYKLKAQYFFGWALSQPNQLNKINPETSTINNTIKTKFNMFSFNDVEQSFYLKAQRIDLTGDSKTPFDTNHYYEYGLGFLWDMPAQTQWLKNIGIGVNINTGSVISGGSVVIYFNET